MLHQFVAHKKERRDQGRRGSGVSIKEIRPQLEQFFQTKCHYVSSELAYLCLHSDIRAFFGRFALFNKVKSGPIMRVCRKWSKHSVILLTSNALHLCNVPNATEFHQINIQVSWYLAYLHPLLFVSTYIMYYFSFAFHVLRVKQTSRQRFSPLTLSIYCRSQSKYRQSVERTAQTYLSFARAFLRALLLSSRVLSVCHKYAKGMHVLLVHFWYSLCNHNNSRSSVWWIVSLPIQRCGCIAFVKESCTQQQCARVQLLVFGVLFAYKAAHKAITKRKSARVPVQTHARARERNFPWKKGHFNRALKRATKWWVRVL